MDNGRSLWRINQFILPFYTMPPGGDLRGGRMWVPVDDEHCIKWMYGWYPTRAIMESTKEAMQNYIDAEDYIPTTNEPYGHVIPKANKANDYLIDWETHTTRRLGVSGVNLQDKCIQENEGPTPILDRSKENLCVGDLTIVKARRMLKEAALAWHENGTIPPGVRDTGIYRVRAVSTVVPDNADWVASVKDLVTVTSDAA